jgi:hypothetical protein
MGVEVARKDRDAGAATGTVTDPPRSRIHGSAIHSDARAHTMMRGPTPPRPRRRWRFAHRATGTAAAMPAAAPDARRHVRAERVRLRRSVTGPAASRRSRDVPRPDAAARATRRRSPAMTLGRPTDPGDQPDRPDLVRPRQTPAKGVRRSPGLQSLGGAGADQHPAMRRSRRSASAQAVALRRHRACNGDLALCGST